MFSFLLRSTPIEIPSSGLTINKFSLSTFKASSPPVSSVSLLNTYVELSFADGETLTSPNLYFLIY